MATINPTVQQWVQNAREAPEEFWARAADELPWFRKWDSVFERDDPSFRWFVGARTNLAYNCLDHTMLPKTRSGKIMRRILKAVTLGTDPGDITTIEEEGSVEDARQSWEAMRAELSQ